MLAAAVTVVAMETDEGPATSWPRLLSAGNVLAALLICGMLTAC